jgi:hypothetical protein
MLAGLPTVFSLFPVVKPSKFLSAKLLMIACHWFYALNVPEGIRVSGGGFSFINKLRPDVLRFLQISPRTFNATGFSLPLVVNTFLATDAWTQGCEQCWSPYDSLYSQVVTGVLADDC